MDVTIRDARGDELATIQSLNHDLFVHDQEYDPTLWMNWPFEDNKGARYFMEKINHANGVCLVAEMNGEIVGYVAGSMKKAPSHRDVTLSELENMLVKDGHRGQGIGGKLAKAFVDWSREQGAQRVTVSAYAGNADAVQFYKNQGFIPYATELELVV